MSFYRNDQRSTNLAYGFRYLLVTVQKDLDDLVVVLVRCEYERGDVGRKRFRCRVHTQLLGVLFNERNNEKRLD